MAEQESPVSKVMSYTATRDMTDSLRLEVSSISPKQQEQLNQGVRLIADKIVQDYGKFMSSDTIKKAKTADVRTILVSKNDFHPFLNEWTLTNDLPGDEEGAMLQEGRISVVQDFASQKEKGFKIVDEVSQQELIELSEGDEEEARMHLAQMNIGHKLAHETLHQMHSEDLPTYFAESANFYYQRELDKEMPMYTFLSVRSAALAAEIYQDVVEKFGDDVHKVYFGSQQNKDLEMQIKGYLFYYLSNARERGLELDNIFQDKQKFNK